LTGDGKLLSLSLAKGLPGAKKLYQFFVVSD